MLREDIEEIVEDINTACQDVGVMVSVSDLRFLLQINAAYDLTMFLLERIEKHGVMSQDQIDKAVVDRVPAEIQWRLQQFDSVIEDIKLHREMWPGSTVEREREHNAKGV